jgi:hypothetical protein
MTLYRSDNLNRNDIDFRAKNFERLIHAMYRGGGDLQETLKEVHMGMKYDGTPPLVLRAAEAQYLQRELIMPSFEKDRDYFKAQCSKSAVTAGTIDNIPQLVAYHQLASGYFASLRNISILDAILEYAQPWPANLHFAITTAIGNASNPTDGNLKPLLKLDFAGDAVLQKKAVAVCVITNDLKRMGAAYAEPAINAAVRQAVAASADVTTLGVLLAGGTPIASTNNPREDLAAALAAIPLDQNSRPMIFTSPQVVKQLALLGTTGGGPAFADLVVPSGGSISGMPVGSIDGLHDYSGLGDVLLVVDAARLAGDSGVALSTVATDASLKMDDAGGSPSGSNVVSLFQTDSSAIRIERYFSLVRPFLESVAVISHVDYSAGSP